MCPSGGSQCHIEELAQNSEGQFQVRLAEVSDKPFYWNSSTGLFTGSSLASYADTTVRIAGSRERHVVTCAQDAPCDVMNLTISEDQGRIKWFGTENVHVSADETGFFLLGDKEVTYPDGTEVVFSCPNGCGIDRIFIDSQGNYAYHYNDRWESPELEFASSSGGTSGGQIRDPQVIPPPVQTSNYANLPAAFAKFPVNHWELQDVLTIRSSEPDKLLRSEVVCPGLESNGHLCTVKGRQINIKSVLEEMDGRIVSQTTSPDEYGYWFFGPDLEKLLAAVTKFGSGQALTPDEQVLFDGFNALGQWGQHSAFGFMFIPDNDIWGGVSVNYFAFGDLYGRNRGGMPKPMRAEETATWRGSMIGSWSPINAYDEGGLLSGKSELEYNFADNDLALVLTIEADSGQVLGSSYTGTRVFGWEGVKQNGDGSFFINGNHVGGINPSLGDGMLDGDFYGPNAEEVAGIFERFLDNNHLTGAFGGKRVIDNQPAN